MSTTNHGHGHDEPVLGAVNPDAVRAGHEPDNTFAVKPIMGIPIAVVVTFVIAFTVAAGSFAYLNSGLGPDRYAHPDAVARNEKGTNDRLDRVAREGLFKNKPEIDQPRLEPLKRLEKDGMFFARPEMPTGNSPEIHPDEIKPDRVAALNKYEMHGKEFAAIPIDVAMDQAVKKKMFPVQKNGSMATLSSDKPSASNGGHGVQPAAPKVEEPKKNEPKKNDTPKKEEPPKK